MKSLRKSTRLQGKTAIRSGTSSKTHRLRKQQQLTKGVIKISPKEKHEQEMQAKKPTYSFQEVDGIAQLIQSIYALDDAVANQEMLKRPVSFIQPLRNMRESINAQLSRDIQKGAPKVEKPEDGEHPSGPE